MKILLYGEDEAYEKFGRESSLITLSHRGDLDWVAGYVISTFFGFMHVRKGVPTLKKTSTTVPVERHANLYMFTHVSSKTNKGI